MPPGFGLGPLGREQGPEGGAVDHDTIVEIHGVGGGGKGGIGGFGGRGAGFGALLHQVGEGGEFVAEFLQVVVAAFGLGLAGFVALAAGGLEVGEFSGEAGEVGAEVLGEEGGEGVVLPAVDAEEGDEAFFLGAEGEVDGALFVAFEVIVFKEVEPEPVAEGFVGAEAIALGGPSLLEGLAGGVVEAVGAIGVVAAEVQNPVGKAFLVPFWGGETTEGEAQAIGKPVGGAGVGVGGFPGGKGFPGGPIDGGLCPVLSIIPTTGARLLKFYGGFTGGFVLTKAFFEFGKDLVSRFDGKKR